MRRTARALAFGVTLGLLAASAASAQTLDEVCPGAETGTGALWGAVTDSDADMILPGASVYASWDADGEGQRAEVSVGLDGSYTICYVPLGPGISLYASFANMNGEQVEVSLTEVFTRQDLSLSMSGSGAVEEEDRIWLCVDGGESFINVQFTRLLRCDQNWQPLEQCPKEELGRISVQPIGAGSGVLREMVEQLVQEAKRIGANAVVNVRDDRGGTSFGATEHPTVIVGEGVRIEVDPSTCN